MLAQKVLRPWRHPHAAKDRDGRGERRRLDGSDYFAAEGCEGKVNSHAPSASGRGSAGGTNPSHGISLFYTQAQTVDPDASRRVAAPMSFR